MDPTTAPPHVIEHVPSSYDLRPALWRDITRAQWDDWIWQQQNRIRTAAQLEAVLEPTPSEREALRSTQDLFRIGITPHYAALIEREATTCPVRLQCVPQLGETVVLPFELEDPLGEEAHMPVPSVTHRYPDRVLFYVTHHCPVYCRHCTRKRKVGAPQSAPRRDVIEEGLRYIESTPSIRDVLVSGGDPLTLSNERLGVILRRLRRIAHLDVIRLGTRNPVTLPQRIDEGLESLLREVGPVYVNTHFNHPSEATREAEGALARLRAAGCVLGNQMVLLAGVNDDAVAVEQLNRWLLRQGCRPYYVFQADMAQGITHMRTPLERGIALMAALRGRLSGLGVPQFVIDLPGGGGKVPLVPEYAQGEPRPDAWGQRRVFANWRGERFEFVDVDGARLVSQALSGRDR